MTQPATEPDVLPGYKWSQDTHDALLAGMPGGGIDRLTQLAAGNDHLVTNPGLVQALYSGNATTEQAGAINHFLAGLEAEKQVNLARAQGQKLTLSSLQQTALDEMHVDYSDVNQTVQQKQAAFVQQLSQKGLVVARDANGQVQLDANGQPIVTKAAKPHQNLWQRALGDTMGALVKGWNFTSAMATKEIPSVIDQAMGANTKTDSAQMQDAEMRAAGYDPNSFFSYMAYAASGKDHFINLAQKLAPGWDATEGGSGLTGNQAVLEAISFTSDPAGYRQRIELDQGLSTEEKAQKLAFINSDAFMNLAKRVGAKTASIGNLAVDGAIDPIKHPTLYGTTSAGVDFAASLLLDPTLLAGKAIGAVRAAQVGIKAADGSIDSTKVGDMFRAMDDMSTADKLKNPFVAGLGRRWTDILDQTQTIARDTATSSEKAAAYAKLQAQYPEVVPLLGDLTGANRITHWADGVAQTGRGEAFTSLSEVGDYLQSKMALTRAFQGKAALQTSLMPGATSYFGYRALRGLAASNLAGSAEKINLARLTEATSVLPKLTDAIDQSGKVLAARTGLEQAQAAFDAGEKAGISGAEARNLADQLRAAQEGLKSSQDEAVSGVLAKAKGAKGPIGDVVAGHLNDALNALDNGQEAKTALASAQRAAFNDPALRGMIQQNLLRKGTVDGSSFSLNGVRQARIGLLGRRLTTLLPRNTVFTLGDPQATEKVYRYAQMYMNKGDAALLAAKWAGGDEGARRSLMTALQLQTAHAAGFGYTEGGQKALAEIEKLNSVDTGALGADRSYGHKFSPEGLDKAEDPALGGQTVHLGLHAADVNKQWELPAFGKLMQDANRFGIWDRTFGRVLTHAFTDQAMHGFKMAQLFKPSTFTRNMVEGWANAAIRGELKGGIRAKALMTEVEQQAVAKAKTEAKTLGLDKAATKAHIDAARPIPKQGWLMRKVPHLIMGSWYRSAVGRAFGDEAADKYVIDLLSDGNEAQRMMHGFGMQHLLSDVDPSASADRLSHYEAGFGSTEVKFKKQIDGFEAQPTSGFDGAQRYVNALGRRLQQYPQYGRVLLDAAKSGDGDLTALKAVIEKNQSLKNDLAQLRFSSLYQDASGDWVTATNAAERQEAMDQLLHKQVADVKYHLTDQNGNWIQKVEDEFKATNRVPDAAWVQRNLTDDERAKLAVAPTYIAAPLKPGASGFIDGILQTVDRGYVRLVEDPIQRTTSMPIYLHNYGQARVLLSADEKRLVAEHGFTPEAADAVMKESAMKQAWIKTEATIDDPGAKTQMDIVGRNFFAYSRAVQAMIRRWGQAIVQDPTRMVKAALAVQAAEHAGMIWTDENGELNFTYPAVGPMIHALTTSMAHLPMLGGFAQLPTVPDLTGKVMLAVPGLENPFKMSATPIVNVPFRMVESLVTGTPADLVLPGGDHLTTLMDHIDRGVNGPIGAGQIGSQFEPTLLRNYVRAFSKDERNGMLASATTGAFANLYAAGYVPAENATHIERQNFIDRLRTSVRNQVFLRAVFGMWMPAAPSAPTNETHASHADYAFSATGIHGLDSEFKQMIGDMGGDYQSAVQLWTQMHPDKLVYTLAKSTSSDNRAYLPATQKVLAWAQNNASFIQKYKTVAGYFAPNDPGQFDPTAYTLETKIGLRQRRTPQEFMDTIQTNADNQIYKAMTDKFDQAIKTAQGTGDQGMVSGLRKQRATAVQQFNLLHPLHADARIGYETKASNARDAMQTLRDLVADPHAPADIPVHTIAAMLQSWDNYQAWKGSVGNSTQQERDARVLMAHQFDQHMVALAQSANGLGDLYDGVFRQLDNQLTDLNAQT